MSDPRSVVITGASRGLGLASATLLYQQGWRVVAAMRSPEAGLERLRAATGAGPDDSHLIGVRLDLDDRQSVAAATEAITEAVGAPDILVHNAGIAAAGSVEELPMNVWEEMFSTHVLGPVELTKALLPAMRAARRGRIIIVSSQGGVRGIPCIAAYSAAKGAAERWAESMANEIAPFGLGVTVLVAGTFDTEMITDATPDYRNFEGPYAPHHNTIDRRGRAAMELLAAAPLRFAEGLAQATRDTGPFTRHAVGTDARMLVLAHRFMPSRTLHQVTRVAMGLPRHGALRPSEATTDLGTRLFLFLNRVLPESVMNRLLTLAAKLFPPKPTPQVAAVAGTESPEPPAAKERENLA